MAILQLNPNTSHFWYLLNTTKAIKNINDNYRLWLVGSNFLPDSGGASYTYNGFYDNCKSNYSFAFPFDSNDTVQIAYESNINSYDTYYYDDAQIKHYFKYIDINDLSTITDINNLYLYINKKITWSDIDSTVVRGEIGTCLSYTLAWFKENESNVGGEYLPNNGDELPSDGILLYSLYVSDTDNPITYSLDSLHKDNIEFFIKFINN